MAHAKGTLVLVSVRQANGSTEVRRGVVIVEGDDGIEVVYGQGQKWSACSCPVEVKKGNLMGKYMELTKDTYFCDMQVVTPADIVKVYPHECLLSWLPRFDAVALEARQRLAPRQNAPRALPLPGHPKPPKA